MTNDKKAAFRTALTAIFVAKLVRRSVLANGFERIKRQEMKHSFSDRTHGCDETN